MLINGLFKIDLEGYNVADTGKWGNIRCSDDKSRLHRLWNTEGHLECNPSPEAIGTACSIQDAPDLFINNIQSSRSKTLSPNTFKTTVQSKTPYMIVVERMYTLFGWRTHA